MIVSASRRTDIPAFYSDWFMERLKEGYLYVKNPNNRKQVSKIVLNQETIDCFVFWTKNAGPMLNKLPMLDKMGYNYYFQFTITPYQSDVEPGLKNKNAVIDSFHKLSSAIGKDRVIWRYDPILLNSTYTLQYHEAWFEALCKRLSGYTEKCVISFLDFYTKTQRNTKDLSLIQYGEKEMNEIAEKLSKTAEKYGIVLETCSEAIDLSKYGIQKGKCIDDQVIEKVLGSKIKVSKDDTQREVCGCVKSVDIGQYNTCRHYCKYCYANFNYAMVTENLKSYDVHSPLLAGELKGDEKITVREMKSVRTNDFGEQMEMDFDSL